MKKDAYHDEYIETHLRNSFNRLRGFVVIIIAERTFLATSVDLGGNGLYSGLLCSSKKSAFKSSF